MRIVVSDSSPLHYLVSVQHADLLLELFGGILVSPAVIRELSHSNTPATIRQWVKDRPRWLTVHPLSRPLEAGLLTSLDLGEAEAIQLAEEQQADVLILDESKGRAAAQRRGLPLIGSIGILGLAYQKRIIENPLTVLTAMRDKGFRIDHKLVDRFQQLLRSRYAR